MIRTRCVKESALSLKLIRPRGSRISRFTSSGLRPAAFLPTWFYWALLSAVFEALTAIFAKIGIQGVDSDLATLIRCFRYLSGLRANGAIRWLCLQKSDSFWDSLDWQPAHRGFVIFERYSLAMPRKLRRWIN
jgi:hypothetical protein